MSPTTEPGVRSLTRRSPTHCSLGRSSRDSGPAQGSGQLPLAEPTYPERRAERSERRRVRSRRSRRTTRGYAASASGAVDQAVELGVVVAQPGSRGSRRSRSPCRRHDATSRSRGRAGCARASDRVTQRRNGSRAEQRPGKRVMTTRVTWLVSMRVRDRGDGGGVPAGRDPGRRGVGGRGQRVQLRGPQRGAGDHARRWSGRSVLSGARSTSRLADRWPRGPPGGLVDLRSAMSTRWSPGCPAAVNARCLSSPAADLPAELWDRLVARGTRSAW